LSVYSFAAIYVFAYYSHHDLTHTTALAAMAALAWYVFVRLTEAPTLGWYLALGAVFGLGLLGKWNFVMLAAALPLACLVRPGFRSLVLTWKICRAQF
jgi:4-amino-4-deoxy-L-arabinose transferase-like glycosyltransferase